MTTQRGSAGVVPMIAHLVRTWWLPAFCLASLSLFALRAVMLAIDVRHSGAFALSDFNLFYFAFDTVTHHASDIGRLYDRAYLFGRLHELGVGIPQTVFSFYGYPPQYAVLLSPLALLPLQVAKSVWLCATFTMMVSTLWMLTVLFIDKASNQRLRFFAFALALTGVNMPFLTDVYWGQSDSLIVFLVTLTCFFKYGLKRSFLAGVPIGLAIVFKMTPAVVVLFFLIRKDWRLCIGAGLTSLACTLVTAMVTGWAVLIHYLRVDLSALTKLAYASGPAPWNSSFRGALELVLAQVAIKVPDGLLSTASLVHTVVILAIVISLTWKKPENRHCDIALASLLPLVTSPVVEMHHALLALIALLAASAVAWIRWGEASARPGGISLQQVRDILVELLPVAVAVVIFTAHPRSVSYYVAMLATFVAVVLITRAPSPRGAAERVGLNSAAIANDEAAQSA